MGHRINVKRAALWGTAVFIIHAVFMNVVWMNPLVSGLYASYEGHPAMKPMEAFGGTAVWVSLNMAFGTVFTALLITLFLLLHRSIPGGGWKKGLFFGITIAMLKALPEAFNQWMLFDYPRVLIAVQLLNTTIGLVVFGILLSVVYERSGAVPRRSDSLGQAAGAV